MLRRFNCGQLTSALHLPKKGSLLGENEPVFLREAKIREPLPVSFQPGTIAFVVRQTRKRDQSERDVVGPLMRHPVAQQIAPAFGNDGEPALRVGFEQMLFERVELISNKDGDGHAAFLPATD